QSASQLAAGLLIGIEPQQNDPIEQHLIAGRVTALQAGEYQLFLGHLLARSLNVTVGDKVRLMVTEASQFTPLGRLPSQ
ncbi:lipoprotein-releasing system transmembrane subunit LolC, partial [Klebsiella pneumoniae]|nr:lipoprotein-releasing system transmembrane subunit LolC [Klebsiella pneumoniae]